MIRLNFTEVFLLLFLMNSWNIGQTKECGDLQEEINGRCCNKCRPGFFMMDICSENHQTTCSPCENGSYSDKYNLFDRCEKCITCQQDYGENCAGSTKGTCSCQSGFLCSDNLCSKCEENKCTMVETLNRTDTKDANKNVVKYSYQCVPKCLENNYFDLKDDKCKPWTKCSTLGLIEKIPGNKTHDSVCSEQEENGNDKTSPEKPKDITYIILCIGFVLLSSTIFIFVFYTCLKNLRKHNASKKMVQPVLTKTSDFHLSKEESGLHLIISDEDKNSVSFIQQDLENVSSLS